MRRRTLIGTIGAAAGTLATRAAGLAHGTPDARPEATTMTNAPTAGCAPANGLDVYDEVHGNPSAEHPPPILPHGAYGTAGMFAAFIPALATNRPVIVPEMQAHGHSADIDRPIRYESMADDVAALLDHLGVARADVFGHSMGGSIGLRLAMRPPDRVRKLVVASASSTSGGMSPEMLAIVSTITPETWTGAPVHFEEYLRIAADPDGLPNLVEKLKDLDGPPKRKEGAMRGHVLFIQGAGRGAARTRRTHGWPRASVAASVHVSRSAIPRCRTKTMRTTSGGGSGSNRSWPTCQARWWSSAIRLARRCS